MARVDERVKREGVILELWIIELCSLEYDLYSVQQKKLESLQRGYNTKNVLCYFFILSSFFISDMLDTVSGPEHQMLPVS